MIQCSLFKIKSPTHSVYSLITNCGWCIKRNTCNCHDIKATEYYTDIEPKFEVNTSLYLT